MNVIITATELKKNLGHYLELSEKQEISISKNGQIISKLVPAKMDRAAMVEACTGIIPSDISLEDERAERLSKK